MGALGVVPDRAGKLGLAHAPIAHHDRVHDHPGITGRVGDPLEQQGARLQGGRCRRRGTCLDPKRSGTLVRGCLRDRVPIKSRH